MKKNNVVLIGMPGCGKSTLGVVLAKLLCKDFVDVDLLIQRRVGMGLQEYIDRFGLDAFLRAEVQTLLDLDVENAVIATGGSAPLLQEGADRLRALGEVVWLDLPLPEIERRVTNLQTRGIAMRAGETLAEVYAQRTPRYRAIADRHVTLGETDIATGAMQLAALLKK